MHLRRVQERPNDRTRATLTKSPCRATSTSTGSDCRRGGIESGRETIGQAVMMRMQNANGVCAR